MFRNDLTNYETYVEQDWVVHKTRVDTLHDHFMVCTNISHVYEVVCFAAVNFNAHFAILITCFPPSVI